MDDENINLTNLLQNAFDEAKKACPLDAGSKFIEIQPGLRVPGDDWDGYDVIAEAFDMKGDTVVLRRKARKALVLTVRAMNEEMSGGNPNWEGLERLLRNIILEGDADGERDSLEHQKAVIFDHKRLKPGNAVQYHVLDEGKEIWLGKYQLKKAYPDEHKNMLKVYKEKVLKERQGVRSEERGVIEQEAVLPKREPAVGTKEDDVHQGSAMVGSTDEKKAAMDLALKAQHACEEGHGEGGGVYDEIRGAGQNKKHSPGIERRHVNSIEKEDEVLPTPPTQKIYSGIDEQHVAYGVEGARKRLSEPILAHNASPAYGIGKEQGIAYKGVLGSKSAHPAKRTRFSVGDAACAGGSERPYVSSARTDTASVAMELLSKVISNEKMLCEALEEEKARNLYLEEQLMEKNGASDDDKMYQVDEMIASQLQKTTASLEEYRSKYDAEREKAARSLDENASLKSDIKDLQHKVRDAEAKKREITANLEEKDSEIESLKAKIEEMENTMEQRQNESMEKSREILAELQTRLQEHEDISKRHTSEMRKKSLEVESLESKIEELEKTVERKQKEIKEKSYEFVAILGQLQKFFAANRAVEVKKLSAQLKKAAESQGQELQKVTQSFFALKQQADGAKADYQEALDDKNREIIQLNQKLDRFEEMEKERKEKGDKVVENALAMQAEARSFLTMIKSGKRYTFENPENDGRDEDLAEVEDPEERQRLSMLNPYYWREVNDVGMKPRILVASTKQSKVVLTISFPEKNRIFLYDSEELHSRENCLLPLVKFYESRVTSSRKDKKPGQQIKKPS